VQRPFRFIHCSDWHLPGNLDAEAGPLELKQRLSRLSWRLSRRRRYSRAVFDAAMKVWLAADIDRVCVTGDLVNFAEEPEFARAAIELARLAEKSPVSLIPGNHDALVRAGRDHQERYWGQWLKAAPPAPGWPTVTVAGPMVFIGVSTAISSPPFLAWGQVSESQLSALKAQLLRFPPDRYFRVVMLHHPPQARATGWRHALRNAEAVRDVLADAGAELVLHGHLHRETRSWLVGPDAPIPVFGSGSCSRLAAAGKQERGHFSLFEVKASSSETWELEVTDYFHDVATGTFRAGPITGVRPPPPART
jgi:3',5'-cyclic AMP phosphodiesterase CpdA